MRDPFSSEGQWFKGNLHLHTTGSDGKLSPQEVITSYAAHGYDFLSITDHRQVTPTDGLDHKGMLMLPGIELNGGKSDLGTSYHMVAVGARGLMEYDPEWSAQELIDYANQNAEVVFIAHPYWCSLTVADLIDLENYMGVEVYNTTCHHGIGRGDSGSHWDDLLARGKRLMGFAVDDAHFGYPDAWVGYIMVKAAKCERDDIIGAIKAGDFYSSNGPTINNIELDRTRVRVECSPCWEVRAVCPLPGRGITTYRTDQKPPFTAVEFELNESTDPIRIECIDEVGNKAWSNPIWLED